MLCLIPSTGAPKEVTASVASRKPRIAVKKKEKEIDYQRRNTKSKVPNSRYLFSFSSNVTLFCSH